MSEDGTEERDDQNLEESETEDRSRGFHLEAGLRPLSELLGNLIEVSVSESPPPPENPVEWTTVEENDGERREDEAERERTKRVRKTESTEYLIDTRFDDDEFVVTADIPGASTDDLSVGINPRTNDLVISEAGAVLERVRLPWRSSEATKVWFNNGVLEVRLRESEP